MPVHDWTRVDAGTFHNFHLSWTVALCNALKAGNLLDGFFATVERAWEEQADPDSSGDDLVADGRMRATAVLPPEEERYARIADRVTVQRGLGDVVAAIEILSPGNKSSRKALQSFVEKAVGSIRKGVNLLVVDLFPASDLSPGGIHPLIWDEIAAQSFFPPADKTLTLVSYQCGVKIAAYVEPVAIGDKLCNMPLFLLDDRYVQTPLEETYQATWNVMPRQIKRLFEAP